MDTDPRSQHMPAQTTTQRIADALEEGHTLQAYTRVAAELDLLVVAVRDPHFDYYTVLVDEARGTATDPQMIDPVRGGQGRGVYDSTITRALDDRAAAELRTVAR